MSITAAPTSHVAPTLFPRRSLLWLLFSTNALALALAVAVLALSPITVSWPPRLGEALVLVGGLVALLATNFVLMRRALRPLGRLWQAMRLVDPLHPGERIDVGAVSIEVAELTDAFNAMLERLEVERRESARRTQNAQEDERRRLARELHDEVGQDLTALMLRIELAARSGSDAQRAVLEDCRESARDCLDHIREIARGLRPEALDDLGLVSALTDLCERVSHSGSLDVVRRFEPGLPRVTPDAELVIYRVVQESLTNAMRHSGAHRGWVELDGGPAGMIVRIRDDGHGATGTREGLGITGMRERALLIGGWLTIADSPAGGTAVELVIPAAEVLP